MLHISEIFLSVQGEGIRTGVPTVFIRTQGCSLRCSFCDTKYALKKDDDCKVMKVSECVELARGYRHLCRDICLTGGEPLEQELWDIRNLIAELAKVQGFYTTIETGGHKSTNFLVGLVEFNGFGDRVSFCVDYKLPSSKMIGLMNKDAFSSLRSNDSVKYVVGNEEDWRAAVQHLTKLREKGIEATALFSPVWGALLNIQELAERMLTIETNLHPIRFSLQVHKVIWGSEKRGV